MKEKADAKKRDTEIEREARGKTSGEKREEMIAVSWNHFGELKGDIVVRTIYLPESQQTPKTFTDPKGGEFKLLKDPECVLGTQIVDVARLSTHLYCSETCYVQSMPPSIQEEQLQDFLDILCRAQCDIRPSASNVYTDVIRSVDRKNESSISTSSFRLLSHSVTQGSSSLFCHFFQNAQTIKLCFF